MEELRTAIRKLAENEIAPHAREADESEQYPWESWRAWQSAGFAGLAFPESFGGQGAGSLAHAIAVEEVARVCGSSSLFTFISKLGMVAVLEHASPEMQARILPLVASGEHQASYCLSEPNAGS